ncbi:uncharacterized protein LOC133817126 [Humulus lupulus]|uniref:uncharacterized protein LOC133817126 n=1 Tax=Humulus lupulus TaxID=3486 RepID=UPI002B413B3C|nr:uncharacterized protein LOC133817126 [Humulus lupulus]
MNGGPESWGMMIRCAGTAHDKSVINPVMLRFRPIAPKPSGSGSDVVSGTGLGSDNKSSLYSKGMMRKKRKYVRVRRNSGYTRKKKSSISRENTGNPKFDVVDDDRTVTLQLLPEKSDLNRSVVNGLDLISNSSSSNSGDTNHRDLRTWLDWKKPESHGQSKVTDRRGSFVVHTWVTVESVTATCTVDDRERDHDNNNHQGYGSTDVERVRNLEIDTCPGFISDGSNSVLWVNGAFRSMVVREGENDGLSPEIMVVLVIKEKLPSFYSSLTGHVKLHYTIFGGGMENEKYSRIIVPCDLWRMDGGGFAWRLDVEAALTLGR